MSIQFGRVDFDGLVDAKHASSARARIAPHGPVGLHEFSQPGVHILYLPFFTTKESRYEKQPLVLPSSAVLTWDGRLDNRHELIGELRNGLSVASPDVDIVAAAYNHWR